MEANNITLTRAAGDEASVFNVSLDVRKDSGESAKLFDDVLLAK
jgi:hypothetical protein